MTLGVHFLGEQFSAGLLSRASAVGFENSFNEFKFLRMYSLEINATAGLCFSMSEVKLSVLTDCQHPTDYALKHCVGHAPGTSVELKALVEKINATCNATSRYLWLRKRAKIHSDPTVPFVSKEWFAKDEICNEEEERWRFVLQMRTRRGWQSTGCQSCSLEVRKSVFAASGRWFSRRLISGLHIKHIASVLETLMLKNLKMAGGSLLSKWQTTSFPVLAKRTF